jgi:hypothetical protein
MNFVQPGYETPAVVYLGDNYVSLAQVSAVKSYTNAGWSDQNYINKESILSIRQYVIKDPQILFSGTSILSNEINNSWGLRLDIGEAFVFKTNC